jgi:hypothetical protein
MTCDVITETLLRAREVCAEYIENSDIQSTASESEMKKSRKLRYINENT